MKGLALALSGAYLLQRAFALPASAESQWRTTCPPFSGSFNISAFQLYPENSDFDSIHCKLYAGANFNASVLVYDPYTEEQSTITLPGITGVSPYHVSGINFDPRTGIMYFCANSGNPFVSRGSNLSGPNKLVKYDTYSETILDVIDMADFQAAAEAEAGHAVSGFQDIDQDDSGNTYSVATYGGAFAKITPDGVVSVFYASSTMPNNVGTYNGVVVLDNKLVTLNSVTGVLQAFDINSINPSPINVTVSGVPSGLAVGCDAIYAPPKYGKKIILCSDDSKNSLVVYHSDDCWDTAEFLGQVANPLTQDRAFPTASVQIANSIYINEEYFFDTGVYDVPGTRAIFPFTDVTGAIEEAVGLAGN